MEIESTDLRGGMSRCPVIAILRGITPDEVESIGDALERAGVTIVEVPLNSPKPLQSIETLARVFGARILVGAGTLTDPVQVTEVTNAGGRLLVRPHADLSVVRAAKQAGLFAVPGFFNPTEAFALLKAGADAIKLFSAEVLGPSTLKALRAVVPKGAIVIPVGGIDARSIPAWSASGAEGFGAGSSICRSGNDAETAKQNATVLLDARAKLHELPGKGSLNRWETWERSNEHSIAEHVSEGGGFRTAPKAQTGSMFATMEHVDHRWLCCGVSRSTTRRGHSKAHGNKQCAQGTPLHGSAESAPSAFVRRLRQNGVPGACRFNQEPICDREGNCCVSAQLASFR